MLHFCNTLLLPIMDITLFHYENTQQIRTVFIENAVWFVVADIADVLDLVRGSRTIERLDEDEVRQTYITDSMGRQQQMYICSESGLYSLILRSDKPEAKSFRKWITKEVLPAIRQTGKYEIVEKVLSPLELLQRQVEISLQHEKMLQAQQAQLNNHEIRIAEIEAQIQTTNKDYYTLAGYYRIKAKVWDLQKTKAQQIGRELTKQSKAQNLIILKVYDDQFGEVNGYHKNVLASVLGF